MAIDVGTPTGVAHGPLGKKPVAELIGLSGRNALRFCTMEGKVRYLIQTNQIERLVVEAPMLRRTGLSMPQATLTLGYHAAVEIAAEKERLGSAITYATSSEWRSALNLRTKAPKHITNQNDRSKWMKNQSLEKCLSYGWHPRDHNEAEAMLLWAWAEQLFDPKTAETKLPLFASA